MSQSDYIKFKRVSIILKDASRNLKPVLTSREYIDYAEYEIETTVANANTLYNYAVPNGSILLFDSVRKITTCPTFKMCSKTNERTNRVSVNTFYNATRGPFIKPIGKYVKHPSYEKTGCKCILNSKYTDNNISCCKKLF